MKSLNELLAAVEFRSAKRYLAAARTGRARAVGERIVARAPAVPEYWAWLADVRYVDGDDLEGAVDAYGEALRLVPDKSDWLKRKARLLIDLKRHGEAADALRALTILESGEAANWHSLGRQLELSKDLEGAVDAYGEALRLVPDKSDWRRRMALAVATLGKNKGWNVVSDAMAAMCDSAPSDMCFRVLLANSFALQCEDNKAAQLLEEILNSDHIESETVFDAAVVYVQLGMLDHAIDCLKTALENTQQTMSQGYLNWLVAAHYHLKREPELIRYLEESLHVKPWSFVARPHTPNEIEARHASARARQLQPVLLNTMPKSGSIYVWLKLAQTLGMPTARVTTTIFPFDNVIPAWLDAFSRCSMIAQFHLNPISENIQAIKDARLSRMVLNLRDPRQATLSWVHHIEGYLKNRLALQFIPGLPSDYDTWSFEEKIDWNLAHHFPKLVDWVTRWHEEAKKGDIEILFVHYEKMIENEEAYFQSILAYLGSDYGGNTSANLAIPEQDYHFRKGLPAEWKTVFSEEQKAVAAAQISPDLARRFSWDR